MAKVKYRIREFKPTANQTGGHSVYAEAVVDNIITNKELAKKVDPQAAAAASGEEDITEGGAGQGGNQGVGTTGGELEG